MKLRVVLASIGALALSLLILGCGGFAASTNTPAVIHLTWAGSPSITRVRLTVTGPSNFQSTVIAQRSEGDRDVTLPMPNGDDLIRIEGLASNNSHVSADVVGLATQSVTVHVGGVPTQAAIFTDPESPPVNNTSCPLSVAVGGEFSPIPTDGTGAIVLLPASDFSYGFTDGSVVDYTAPFFITGKAPGATQVSLLYQSSTLAQFGVIVTP